MIRNCEKCGERYVPLTAAFCPTCGAALFDGPVPYHRPISSPGISPRQLLAFAGSVVLFVGVFTPIVSMPIVGSLNYFQNGKGDGVILLLLAVFSFVLTLGHKYRFLLFTGGGALAILALTFIAFQYRMSQAESDLRSNLANNPFAGIGEALLSTVQLSWGWAVLIVGGVCLIGAALMKASEPTEGHAAVEGIARISDKSVRVALAVIFVLWLALISYGFFGGLVSGIRSDSSSSVAVTPTAPSPAFSTIATPDNHRTTQQYIDDTFRAANLVANVANAVPINRDLPRITTPPESLPLKAMVISENANFRSTPDSYGDVLDVLPYGEEVEIIKQKGPWFHVRHSNQPGWVHGNTIQLLY